MGAISIPSIRDSWVETCEDSAEFVLLLSEKPTQKPVQRFIAKVLEGDSTGTFSERGNYRDENGDVDYLLIHRPRCEIEVVVTHDLSVARSWSHVGFKLLTTSRILLMGNKVETEVSISCKLDQPSGLMGLISGGPDLEKMQIAIREMMQELRDDFEKNQLKSGRIYFPSSKRHESWNPKRRDQFMKRMAKELSLVLNREIRLHPSWVRPDIRDEKKTISNTKQSPENGKKKQLRGSFDSSNEIVGERPNMSSQFGKTTEPEISNTASRKPTGSGSGGVKIWGNWEFPLLPTISGRPLVEEVLRLQKQAAEGLISEDLYFELLEMASHQTVENRFHHDLWTSGMHAAFFVHSWLFYMRRSIFQVNASSTPVDTLRAAIIRACHEAGHVYSANQIVLDEWWLTR